MNRTLLNGRAEEFQRWARRYALPIFMIALTVGMTLILSFDLPGSRQVSATISRPAPNDIVSPRSLTYASDLLTQPESDARTYTKRLVSTSAAAAPTSSRADCQALV